MVQYREKHISHIKRMYDNRPKFVPSNNHWNIHTIKLQADTIRPKIIVLVINFALQILLRDVQVIKFNKAFSFLSVFGDSITLSDIILMVKK